MSILESCLRKKYWISDFIRGSGMRKEFVEVSRILKDPAGTQGLRRMMLSDILAYAKRNTKFYASVKGCELFDFPVINKSVIQSSRDNFLVNPAAISGQKGDVHIQKTSGSTGTPFEICQDTRCRTRRIALIKAANESFGFHAFMPMMHLRAIRHYWGFPDDLTWKKHLRILYADNANLTDARIRNILKAMDDYGIKFVRGYMTTLNTLTEYAVAHGIELKTRPTFISVGELLLEPVRKRVVDMGCHIVSQYGNEENGVFGQSEIDGPGGTMRLYLANNFLEVLKLDEDRPVDDGELGRLVVTDYTNRVMPMIRYETGDLARVLSRTDDGEVTAITDLAGRKADLIYRVDGSTVDMFNSISPEIYNNPAVRQWQFIQHGKNNYQLILSVTDGSLSKNEERFISLVRETLGAAARVKVDFVTDIPVLDSGKRKVVVQKWDR